MDIELRFLYIHVLRDNWKPLGYKEDPTGGFVSLESPYGVVKYYLYKNYLFLYPHEYHLKDQNYPY